MADVYTRIGYIKGATGATGAQGAKGDTGDAATIQVGSVTTVPYGQTANVVNSGTEQAAILDFQIPQGRPGEQTTDMQNLTLGAITTSAASFPVPAVGETGKVLWGKVVKWFSDMSALVATKLNVANVVNNLTTTDSGYALDARQGKALNDSLSNVKGLQTSTILSQASQLTKSAIAQLDIGSYIVQCASAASDFPVGSAYGMLLIYGSKSNYHHAIFTNSDGLWVLFMNGTTVGDWAAYTPLTVKTMDVNATYTQGTAFSIGQATNYVVGYMSFLNGYVVDTNNIFVRFHTYNNILYAKFYNAGDGSEAASGTYKLRLRYTS